MNDTTTLCEALIELTEDLWHAHECLAETEGQHRGECHAYGDSWPGAEHDIRRVREGIATIEAQQRWARRGLGLEG